MTAAQIPADQEVAASTRRVLSTAARWTWLRVEGLAVAAAALALFASTGQSWWLVPVLFLAPGLSWFAYLRAARGARRRRPVRFVPDSAGTGILPKLGVTSRLQAVMWAYQNHIVAVPGPRIAS